MAGIPQTNSSPTEIGGIKEPTTLEEYVDKLDKWEWKLLQTTGNVRDTLDITARITNSEQTYMVSNGGMINGYGSYG
jgi:hypothetical protein